MSVTFQDVSIAVRVLKAVCAQQTPEEIDIGLLRSYCSICPTLAPEELAIVVIQEYVDTQKSVAELSWLIGV